MALINLLLMECNYNDYVHGRVLLREIFHMYKNADEFVQLS